MSWLPVTVTSPPASEPITLAQAKAQAKVDGSDSDSWLTEAIARARAEVERVAGIKAITQTVVMRCSAWADLAKLPTGPIASITSVSYLDTDGAEQTLSTDVYEEVLVGLEPEIRLKINQTWPSIRAVSDAIRVTAVAGEAEADKAVIGAVSCAVSAWHDTRQIGDLPESSINCLTNYRRF